MTPNPQKPSEFQRLLLFLAIFCLFNRFRELRPCNDEGYGQAGHGLGTRPPKISDYGKGGVGQFGHSNEKAAGGGGFVGDGGSSSTALGGLSFQNGLKGGEIPSDSISASGGFGGGGSQKSDGSPGGGGFTGGYGEDGPDHKGLNSAYSYNSGTKQSYGNGFRKSDHGLVIVTFVK